MKAKRKNFTALPHENCTEEEKRYVCLELMSNGTIMISTFALLLGKTQLEVFLKP